MLQLMHSRCRLLVSILLIESTRAFFHPAVVRLPLPECRRGALGARHVTSLLNKNEERTVPSASAMVDLSTMSRRSMLAGAVLAGSAVSRPAYAFDFKRVASGDAIFNVPSVWIQTAGDADAGTFAFSNPVSGKVLDQLIVREYEAPDGIASTKDVGKIEKIKPSIAFGATKEVDKADMVAAAVRKGTESKTVFYDFDFAIAPKTCSREMEMLTGSCMYEKIILLSCCVSKGGMYVLEISASAEEWKKNGPTLRSVRDSFNIVS